MLGKVKGCSDREGTFSRVSVSVYGYIWVSVWESMLSIYNQYLGIIGIPMYAVGYQTKVSIWEADNFATSPANTPPNSTELASRVH